MNETLLSVYMSLYACVCVLLIRYLLQVTFPEFELSGQSVPVSLHSRLVSLLLRDKRVIVDD